MSQVQRPNNATASKVLMKCALTGILLLILVSQCSATCRRQTLTHTIRHIGCEAKRVPSMGCRGTCTSYSRVSPTHYTRMERSCQCCQESGHAIRTVGLKCPGAYPSVRMVEIRVPRSCSCRPCHGTSDVPSETRLEDY